MDLDVPISEATTARSAAAGAAEDPLVAGATFGSRNYNFQSTFPPSDYRVMEHRRSKQALLPHTHIVGDSLQPAGTWSRFLWSPLRVGVSSSENLNSRERVVPGSVAVQTLTLLSLWQTRECP